MKANLLKEAKLRLRLYVVGKIMNYECKVKSTKTTMKHLQTSIQATIPANTDNNSVNTSTGQELKMEDKILMGRCFLSALLTTNATPVLGSMGTTLL